MDYKRQIKTSEQFLKVLLKSLCLTARLQEIDPIQKALNTDSGSSRKMSSSFPIGYKADDEFWQ